MRYTACCIVDDPAISIAIFADLGRAGFTDAEISISDAAPLPSTDTSGQLPTHAHPLPHAVSGSSVVGATPGLGIEEDGESVRSGLPQTLPESSGAPAARAPRSASWVSQEQVRTIAYHLCPGRSLISVQTHNSYEVETILEIFREHGGSHCVHFADDLGMHGDHPAASGTERVHDHTTILNERIHELA